MPHREKLRATEMSRLTTDEYRQSSLLPLTVVLDDVRSTYNTGSVFRTADAFGLERVCLCGITPQPPMREIHKTALGAEDSVPWEHYTNALEAVRQLKAHGYTVLAIEQAHGSIGLDEYADRIASRQDKSNAAATDRYAIVLGNEVHGVAQAVVDEADQCIEIPQRGTKHSMNVSVTAGIVMYTLQKAMRQTKHD